MRLVGFCGVNAEPPIHSAIEGERHPLLPELCTDSA